MTTDSLNALKRAYRAGTITVRDQGEMMIDELITRSDNTEAFKAELRDQLGKVVEQLGGE